MSSKEEIYNLALGALLLQRQVTDAATDTSNEVKVLNNHYQLAFNSTLADLDLNSTSEDLTLTLIEADPNLKWSYAYKYPKKCVYLRRIDSSVVQDNRSTHIPKLVRNHKGQKVIFTNQINAIAECIVNDFPLTTLSDDAALAIAYKLAFLSAPLITGKGAKNLRKTIREDYVLAKSEAKEKERLENFSFSDPEIESEFVNERLS